ncbi:MAG: hypothetical protein ACHQ2E_01185 [Gemmatimonadales bacterium]
MRAYIQFSGLLFALVAIGHLVRVLARWPLLIAGYPLPAVASLLVLLVTAGMAAWAWRLLSANQSATGEAGKRPPGT